MSQSPLCVVAVSYRQSQSAWADVPETLSENSCPESVPVKGSQRKGGRNRRFVLIFCCSFLFLGGLLWFLIIPKWLIKAWGHIPICFWTFWELSKNRQNMDPRTSYVLPFFKKYRRTRGYFPNIFCCKSQSFGNSKC